MSRHRQDGGRYDKGCQPVLGGAVDSLPFKDGTHYLPGKGMPDEGSVLRLGQDHVLGENPGGGRIENDYISSCSGA